MILAPRCFALVAFAALATAAHGQNASALATGRFSGSLRGTSFSGVSDATRYSGSVEIAPMVGRPGLFKVEVRLSSSGGSAMVSATNVLQWSISPGRCGSRVQFLVPPPEMPPLELRSGGNAEMIWQGTVNLAANAGYQLVVFDRGLRQEDIVACANLKYSEPKAK